MAVLNELLEEAITRCTDVTQQADTMREALQALTQRAHDLQAALASESESTHRAYQDAAARLQAAEAQMETVAGAALDGMQGLRGAAGVVRGRVSALLAAARQSAAAVEADKDRLAGQLESRTRVTVTALQELTARVAALQEEAHADLGQAAATIQAFRGATEEARAAFAAGQAQVMAALDGIDAFAREQTAAVKEAMNEGAQATSETIVALANLMLEAHNGAVAIVLDRVANETGDHADEALGATSGTFENLGAAGAAGEEAVVAQGATLRSALQADAETAASIHSILESVAVPAA